MRFTIGHDSLLLLSTVMVCPSAVLVRLAGATELLAGSRAGSQRAAGLSAASSFSLKNATSFSHKHKATALQLSHPNCSTTLAWRCILSFETKRFCAWRMSGVTYRNLPKYFPGQTNSQAQQQSFCQTNRPGPAVYSKSHFHGQKRGFTSKLLCSGWMIPTKLFYFKADLM